MKKYVWIPMVLALLVAGAFLSSGQSRGQPAIQVNVVSVTQQEFLRESKATGNVQARVYSLGFPRSGRIAHVWVKEGQRIVANNLLAELDTQDGEIKLRSARESLANTLIRLQTNRQEAQINRTKTILNLEAAQEKLRIQRTLFDVGAVARNEIDELARTVTDLESQVQVLQAQNTSGQSDLEAQRSARQSEIHSLELNLAQAQLRAPVAGTIAKVSYLAGTEAGQGTLELVEDSTLSVKIRLAEADAALVKPGQPVQIELDVAQGRILPGTVERLAVQGEVSGQGGSAILPVILRFTSNQARVLARPGLTASVRITTLRIPDALTIPLEAIVVENKKNFVWLLMPAINNADVKNPEFVLKKQYVLIKARNQTTAAIDGLIRGAKIVSLPAETLKSEDRVRIIQKISVVQP